MAVPSRDQVRHSELTWQSSRSSTELSELSQTVRYIRLSTRFRMHYIITRNWNHSFAIVLPKEFPQKNSVLL